MPNMVLKLNRPVRTWSSGFYTAANMSGFIYVGYDTGPRTTYATWVAPDESPMYARSCGIEKTVNNLVGLIRGNGQDVTMDDLVYQGHIVSFAMDKG